MTQTQRGFLGLVFSIALAPILSTCGSNGLGSCGKVQPCGGDVVGNWSIVGECINTASMNREIMAECPGATVNTSGLRVTGSASFNADMTYSVTEMISATVSETIPASCLTTQGLTCTQLNQLLQQEAAMDPSGISGRCVGSSACTCTFTIPSMTVTDSGTWATSGTNILIDGSPSPYCVQGNELHLMTLNTTMPMGAMGQANIDADVLLKK